MSAMVSICATCNGLQKNPNFVDADAQETHPASSSLQWLNTTLPSLRASTNGGCRACALLLQGVLLHHDRFATAREERVRISAESFHSPSGSTTQDHLSVEVRWNDHDNDLSEDDHPEPNSGYPDLKLEFFTDQDGQSSFPAIGRGRIISDNPLQDLGLSTARGMIKECLSSHSRCRQVRNTTLPKRVLDVLLDDGSKSIRLHDSHFDHNEQRYEYGEYLAFSHVWGIASGIPKTTTESLESHKTNIPWSVLPRAYQEAVALTRALGFRWLWIDSLCLLQDDDSSKLTESLNLDQIFGSAFLTIAATSADNSTQPLFPPKAQPYKIQTTDNKGSLFKIYVREQPSHYSFKAPFDEGSHMNDWELPFNTSEEANLHTPLLKRAWAYVERLLSPRVLHFTKSEMILECREGYQCECGRIDDDLYDPRTTDSVKQEFARVVVSEIRNQDEGRRDSSNGDNPGMPDVTSQLAGISLANTAEEQARKREDALQLWSYIVTEYTARNLTYEADRLVAVASIARELSPTLDSAYIAGQWGTSTLGLLWYPNEGSRSHRSKTPKVPSWSWASVEGSPIFFDNSSAMDLACAASFPSGRDQTLPWSPTSGRKVELTASMAAEVTFQIDAENEYSLVKNGISVEFRPDITPLQGEDVIQAGESLICVLVSMTFRSSIIGLVLKQSDPNTQVYRRIGRFECYECQRVGDGGDDDDDDEEPEDAEALFDHWFPEIEDMTQLDDGPQRTFVVV